MSDHSRFWSRSILATAVVTSAIGGCTQKHPPVVATPAPIVQVSNPLERPVTDNEVFTARTQAIQSVDIKARVTGFLTEIHFKDGDEVKKDQVLFQIDDRPYKAALDNAKATLEFTKAALVKTQAEYDIGLAVQKQSKGAISEQEITRRMGARDEAAANVDRSKAALEDAQLNFNWCKVTSPLDGRANRHFLDIGNIVSKDVTSLTNIVSLKPTWAYFDVDQNTVLNVQKLVAEGKIKGARKSTIPVDMALANSEGFPYKGVIDFISNQVDPNTGTLRLRAVFANEDGAMGAGLFGRVRVPIGASHEALLIAERAIGTNQSQRYILVVNDKNEVEYRAVDVRQVHDGLREVQRFRTIIEPGPDGQDVTKEVPVLNRSDRVIVDGLQRVRPGVTVDPKLVDMVTQLSEPSGKK
jgi:RND family efflux transporter MFP subunit